MCIRDSFKARAFAEAVHAYTQALDQARTLRHAAGMEHTSFMGHTVAVCLCNRAAAHASTGAWELSLADAGSAVEEDPSYVKALVRQGTAALELSKPELASTAFSAALRLSPGHAAAMQGKAAAAVQLGSGGAAVAEFAAQGKAAMANQEYQTAVEAYSAAISCEPKDEKAWSNRSAARAQLGQWAAALQDAQRVVALTPQWVRGYTRCGAALQGLGQLEQAYWHYAKARAMQPQDSAVQQACAGLLRMLCAWDSVVATKRRNKAAAQDAGVVKARVFAISDVHYDHKQAPGWIANISSSDFQQDTLIVAGDAGDTHEAVRRCLRDFKRKFRRVFYCPGNHDLWIRDSEKDRFPDSICKLHSLLATCDELGVDSMPARVAEGVWVVPLLSWYNAQYDPTDPRPGRMRFDTFCKWPIEEDLVWKYFLQLNTCLLEPVPKSATVLSFSHFLPVHNLPYSRFVQELGKAVGCLELNQQIEQLGAQVHVYGHTHMNAMENINGRLYVQHALGYDGEHSDSTPLQCVWDGNKCLAAPDYSKGPDPNYTGF
eukprot:TRINITY_DN39109_c0_g1_i1.p1 TRINITY_DN39109_c0_g1~~TRINITY_DN39109_c0_g1_i1.p1  ORF type:complete len:545 (+),score=183.82 TRINITY_DN39109_c0_g1_i1:142-1776(+)